MSGKPVVVALAAFAAVGLAQAAVAAPNLVVNGSFENRTALGVPEPATWALMLLGFGALSGVIRRARFGQTAAT